MRYDLTLLNIEHDLLDKINVEMIKLIIFLMLSLAVKKHLPKFKLRNFETVEMYYLTKRSLGLLRQGQFNASLVMTII